MNLAQPEKRLAVGLLAHVDAGKTTLAEALLYQCGSIRKLGRVDHRDTFLDSFDLERARGISIFSKQARLKRGNTEICLLDTPGHIDFASETERVLWALDYAVLVISGLDGVQSHTETLWRLLEKHSIPVLVFISKMDLPVCRREELLSGLRERLSENCIDFSGDDRESFYENLAMCSSAALDEYMETGSVSDETTAGLISSRKLFPCIFGSGLRLEGTDMLLDILDKLCPMRKYNSAFGARVYKIFRDAQGRRLSCMKITGGCLRNRDIVNGEKVTGIWLLSGERREDTDEAPAGCVCAVQGLQNTHAGQGLGFEQPCPVPELEPLLSYRIVLPKGCDPMSVLPKLRQLEDEDPMLHIFWNRQLEEIRISLMGKVQTEIITGLIKERFNLDVVLDAGGIMYRETIAAAVEGVGHYEPLRHYAEVHLALEPLPRDSGLQFESRCSEDELDRNWQNLVLTHLAEKQHVGVLTGSPITDMRIALLAGRAHEKHTEGGDFREAVYRAVRQGLMYAESVLLEPWYRFSIELPPEVLGRAISDLRCMAAELDSPGERNAMAVISGTAPVSELAEYPAELLAYTRGCGRINMHLEGWLPCHNTAAVLEACGYDPLSDLSETPDSVFCSHGAGTVIKWDKVREYMHIDTGYGKEKYSPAAPRKSVYMNIDDKELEAIMEKEFGPIRRSQYTKPQQAPAGNCGELADPKKEYIIIDGYNLIFADETLSSIAADNLALARERLIDALQSYQAFRGCELVLVFDGYKVQGSQGEKEDAGGVHVVYTRGNETGDMYIERLAYETGGSYRVRVVTEDSLIRLSALRSGVLRTDSSQFLAEMREVEKRIGEFLEH